MENNLSTFCHISPHAQCTLVRKSLSVECRQAGRARYDYNQSKIMAAHRLKMTRRKATIRSLFCSEDREFHAAAVIIRQTAWSGRTGAVHLGNCCRDHQTHTLLIPLLPAMPARPPSPTDKASAQGGMAN
jgi:hypothetical protein